MKLPKPVFPGTADKNNLLVCGNSLCGKDLCGNLKWLENRSRRIMCQNCEFDEVLFKKSLFSFEKSVQYRVLEKRQSPVGMSQTM